MAIPFPEFSKNYILSADTFIKKKKKGVEITFLEK